MVNEFWKYWKQRWPNASSDENKLRNSANYQETRAAFLAGFEAAQRLRALNLADSARKEAIVKAVEFAHKKLGL